MSTSTEQLKLIASTAQELIQAMIDESLAMPGETIAPNTTLLAEILQERLEETGIKFKR